MEVPVIPNLVTFVGDSSHQLRPALGVAAQDEERGAHTLFRERVEDERSGVGVGAIIECESHGFAVTVDFPQRAAEDWAIAVKRAVCGSAYYCDSKCGKRDHSCVFWRSTAV